MREAKWAFWGQSYDVRKVVGGHGCVCVRIKKGWATMHLTSCRVIVLERFSSHIPISRGAPTPFALS